MTTDPAAPDDAPSGPKGHPMLVRAGAFLGAAAAAVGLFTWLHHSDEEGAARAPVEQAQAVSVAVAEMRQFSRTLTVSGVVRPVNDLVVYAPASGVWISELLVDEGDRVAKGQPLARLDAALAQSVTLAAEAAMKEAEAAASRAADEYARAESIKDSGALSQEAIAARKAQAEAAAARLAAAKAQLAEVEARMQGGFVRAPVAGLVLDRTAVLGAPVDGQALFRIAGGEALEVPVDVGEADMLAMAPGQKARFQLSDGTPIAATLRRLPAAIDSRTRAGEAVFSLAKAEKLRPGMVVSGAIGLAAQSAIAAPQSAVVYGTQGAHLFVVAEGNVAQRRAVTLGGRDGDLIAVREGVQPGERIVARGAAFLQDGDRVRPIEDPPAAPTPEQTPATAAAGEAGR